MAQLMGSGGDNDPINGWFGLLPWLQLDQPIRIGGFRFEPLRIENANDHVGPEIAPSLRRILNGYVDLKGKPVSRCTLIMRVRHARAWDIPPGMWAAAGTASRMLALACMAEQRFFEARGRYTNSTVFRPIFQGFSTAADWLTLSIPRRVGGIAIGGIRHGQVLFQQPIAAYDVGVGSPAADFIRALDRARCTRSDTWSRLTESLPIFLLGHADEPTLPDEACVLLSAIAFERLLGPVQHRAAIGIADRLSKLLDGSETLKLSNAKRVRADPLFAADQADWPIHRKWFKELYEGRNRLAHGAPRPGYSENWSTAEHLIAAAFVYPLAIKLLLKGEGLYTLTPRDSGACNALDRLLDARDWGFSWKSKRQWPSILYEAVSRREIETIISAALEPSKVSPGS